MLLNINQRAFFELVKAGLWEQECRFSSIEKIDFKEVFRIAEEQSVVGVVAAGLDHLSEIKVPKDDKLQFVGQALQLEQRNLAMNKSVAKLVDTLRCKEVHTILFKGQGIAQCYQHPLWRSSGDIDFLLDKDRYTRAKKLLLPMASKIDLEIEEELHQSFIIESWEVELHGTVHSNLSFKIDRYLDQIQEKVFKEGLYRVWVNHGIKVLLPREDEDVIFVFTHFLKHFYKGGLGIRQICDWCRLIWTYRETIDFNLLSARIQKMGLMTEWKAFAVFAVQYLGMPKDAMPFYSKKRNLCCKADRICSFIMEVGNFGHNRATDYYSSYPFFFRKTISFFVRCKDLLRHSMIFPFNSLRFMPCIIWNGIQTAKHGV